MEQNYFGGATFGTSIPNPQIDTALSSIESATYPNSAIVSRFNGTECVTAPPVNVASILLNMSGVLSHNPNATPHKNNRTKDTGQVRASHSRTDFSPLDCELTLAFACNKKCIADPSRNNPQLTKFSGIASPHQESDYLALFRAPSRRKKAAMRQKRIAARSRRST
jgi:hypothetical protein